MGIRVRVAGLAFAFLLLMGVPAVPASARPPEQGPPPGKLSTPELIDVARARGEIGPEMAYLFLAYALGDYEKLPPRYRSDVPWDGTLPLLRLQEAAKTMKGGPIRTELVGILSGVCGSSTPSLPKVRDSTHFHIEYPNNIGGGLTIDDYQTSLEASWSTEIDSFDWAAPPVLVSNPPPGNRYHVRIDTLGGSLYGYVTNSGVHAGFVGDNPNTSWNDGDAYATCMVLNRDYSGFPGSSQQALDATTAHEFNHSIQFGYGAITGANKPDDNLVEGGATWMEDEVYDSANDNYNYLWPTFDMCMGEYTNSPYPYWITFRGLTERYGAGAAGAGEQVMQDFWELTSQSPNSNMLNALNLALVNKGTTLADAYHAYAIAAKFNKTCGSGYVYPYCFEEAAGYEFAAGSTSVHGSIASVGDNYTGSVADYYALNWINLPIGSVPYTVTLKNTSGGGQLRGSVVCDTSSALNVNALSSVAGPGSSGLLTNFDPTGCASVVAVVTNQSQAITNPSFCTSRSYRLSTSIGGSFSIVINELDLGDPDAVELHNSGGQPTDMAGWNFKAYASDGSVDVDYIFPSFTLQPGAYVVLHETTDIDTATDLYIGTNITWANGGSGAAALMDGDGIGVDFVRFGSSSASPPSGTGWLGSNPASPLLDQTLGRDSASTDTDNGSDWYSQNPTLGTQNLTSETCYTLTLVHTGSGTDPVASPAGSSACSNGSYVAGQSVQLTASPDSGWHVASWVNTDNDASPSITNSLTMPADDHFVTVNYEADPPVDGRNTYLPIVVKDYRPSEQMISNGGFETENIVWVQQSGSFPIIGQQYPHSGDWNAWFGGYDLANDRLYQSISIPDWACSTELTLYLYVHTSDSLSIAHDHFHVELQDSSGTTLEEFMWADNTMHSTGWYRGTKNWSDFSAHSGKSRRLFFQVTTDSSDYTNFFLDDVTLWAYCGSLRPMAEESQGSSNWTWKKIDAPPGLSALPGAAGGAKR